MRRIIHAAIFLIIFLVSTAFEIWLEPRHFHYKPEEDILIDFMKGENFVGEYWEGKKYTAEVLQWYDTSGFRDLSKEIKSIANATVTLKSPQEGTQLIVMQCSPVIDEWKVDSFRAYLEDNGLADSEAGRAVASSVLNNPKEYSTSYAKLLIQVGAVTDNTFSKRVGFSLEIIPRKNPYTLTIGDHLECLILYNGKPSPHTLVKVWSRLNNTTFLQNIFTEDDGTITFPVSTRGAWMVSAIRLAAIGKPSIDWRSQKTSLVFGI